MREEKAIGDVFIGGMRWQGKRERERGERRRKLLINGCP